MTYTQLIIALSAIAVIIHLFYKWATRNNDYFVKLDLPHLKPKFVLGNTSEFMLRQKSLSDFVLSSYGSFPKAKIFGLFDFTVPIFMARDPDVLKQIMVKEFDNFEDHRNILDATIEPLLGNALSLLSGQKWRNMRSTLSPAFTGSKMRQMFDLINDVADDMSKYFLVESQAKRTDTVDMKDFFARYTTDVIATSAFGIKVDSFNDRENEFFTMGKSVMDFSSFSAAFKFFVLNKMNWIGKLLNLKFVNDNIAQFFKGLILNTMVVREEKNIFRPDMINLLMQVRKGVLKHSAEDTKVDEKKVEGFATVIESNIGKSGTAKIEWTDDELVAQCLIFFLAGFDTSSTLLSFTAIELAQNKDIQSKLCQEVDKYTEQLNGKPITYEVLQSMKYLDQVICESLRRWPPAVNSDRKCNRDCTLDIDGKKLQIKKDELIWIPIYGLHLDEKYFPDPYKFDPDRFSEENIGNIVSGTYMPFGGGPRNCIGSRFALMQIKAVLYHLLKNVTFEISAKTELPVKMGVFQALPTNGIHLAIRPRNKK